MNRRSFLWYPVAMVCATAAFAADQKAVMRWDSSCIHLTEQSYAEAPMKDGEPNFAETKLHGMKLDRACGVIRVERTK